MKVYEKIQKTICEISDGMEMAGYLDGIHADAVVYCKKNAPDEIRVDESGACVVSIYGMTEFLNSEIDGVIR